MYNLDKKAEPHTQLCHGKFSIYKGLQVSKSIFAITLNHIRITCDTDRTSLYKSHNILIHNKYHKYHKCDKTGKMDYALFLR